MHAKKQTVFKRVLNKNLLVGVSCLCGLVFWVVVNSACSPAENVQEVQIEIDKYIDNLDEARSKADTARQEWEIHREEKRSAEKIRLGEESIPDLAKMAVGLLSRSDCPENIVAKAIDTTENELDATIVEPPWHKSTPPDEHSFWSIISRETIDANHDWWIERNKLFGQYRLVGNPNQSVYFSIHDEKKLRAVLVNIVIFGNIKSFYQVVKDDIVTPKPGCEVLSLDEARKIFPKTVNLAEGIYAEHPCNPYALVPLVDFPAGLVKEKAIECVVLLGRMGAKSVHVSQTEVDTSSVGGGVEISSMGYGAAVDIELAREMNSNLELEVVFSGNSHIDIPATLLENSIWHKTDAQLNGVFSAIMNGTGPKKWRYVEKLQSNFDFDFRAAARILGISEVDLRANFEKVKKTERQFDVVFE